LIRFNQRNPRLEFLHGKRKTDRVGHRREQRDRV